MKYVLLLVFVALAASVTAVSLWPTGDDQGNGKSTSESVGQKEPGAMSRGALRILDPQDPARPYFHDFGRIPYGDVVRWTSVLHNEGPEDVSIKHVRAPCGCLQIESLELFDADGERVGDVRVFDKYFNAVIPVGGTGQLKFNIISSYATANANKLALVRVETNSIASGAVELITYELKFIPTKPFEAAPAELRLLTNPTSHGGEIVVKVRRQPDHEASRLVDVVETPDGITARVVENVFAGKTHWKVYATVPPMTPQGQIRGKVVLSTTDENGDEGRFSIPVVVRTVDDVIAVPGLAAFGRVSSALPEPPPSTGAVPISGSVSTAGSGGPASSRRFVDVQLRALVPGAKVKVLAHRFAGLPEGAFSVTMNPIDPDDAGRSNLWGLTIERAGPLPAGSYIGELILTLEEPFGGGTGELSNERVVRITASVAEGA